MMALIAGVLLASCSQQKTNDGEIDFTAKADSVLALMTLEEKLGQLNLPAAGDITTGQAESSNIAEKIKEGKVGGLFNLKSATKIREVQRIAVEESRLKIPLLFGMDVIHGYETLFPIPLGLSASWDMELIEKSARIAAIEASADGINWTFSPMVDVSRDPRWGRVSEGNGEDPYLGAQIAKAMVKGYQGDDLTLENTIMACVKHFALYGAPEAGRDYNSVDMSRQRMFNEYMLPYKAAVEAGVGTVMTSFNDIDGIPASGNKWLMTDLLRDQWGFNGFVVTDYTAINEMIDHGMGDLQDVSALALNAGVDMDMVGEGFLTTLQKSLDEGRVSEAQINEAVRRILIAKFKLGLFEDPYRYADPERSKRDVFNAEHRKVARKIAAETFVLMKNEGNVLPIEKKGTIAVIGPMGDNKENMAGTWSVAGKFDQAISLRQGLENAVGDKANIIYARGANITEDEVLESRVSIFGKPTYRDDRSAEVMIQEAVAAARKADVIIAAMGESAEMSGEASSRSDIEIPQSQRDLMKALLATGKPVVMVLFTGRPLAMKWEAENVPSILNVWFAGSEAGDAIADVLFGDVNPSGKLTATFPQNVGQVPIFYNHKNTGRPLPEGEWFQKFRSNYLDVPNEPLFPFGFGLSYTTFEYSDIRLNGTSFEGDQKLEISVELKNTGKIDGAEVVQLYVRDLVASITRPVKELKGFEKVFLKAGESKTVTFELTQEALKFYNFNTEFVFEPGEFEIMVGGNSQEVKSTRVTWK
ncbi:beta-glucosidase BglX [Belliella kenyensis]|uniref:Beta-glucosidase BglX n=1 Tax=Belliella kenyensis TaxID=1472724 RepID=A0ABV8ENP3_9BACT|nr:beta-glucosidase BglX [Belliella kenyensis]MCH7403168.1 beta-glucosidase BglX [Belliella kenyensis]MDN3604779.1 beta-glucosidase BglX [Belliella kenyensis]